jgi:ASC-1-like (ASCH) protein
MKIEKKILPEYFDLVLSGKKTYDFRLADFDIAEGDTLVLKEWDGQQETFTGREIVKQVTYVGKIKGDTTWPQEDVEKFGHQIIAFK